MDETLALIEKVYQDDRNLFEILDDDVEWHETEGFPYGGVYRGKQALLEGVFARLGEDWEDFRATPDTFLPAGDRIVTLGHYEGVSRKTGRSMKAEFAHVYTLRAGKVVRFRQIADSASFRAAMG